MRLPLSRTKEIYKDSLETDNGSNIGSECSFEIDLPGKRDRSTVYRLDLIKLYRRKPELANLVMKNSSEGIDSETLYSVKLFMDVGFQGNLRKSQLYFKLPPDRSSYLRMINAKKKERFLPGPGTIVLRQKDTNLVTGKPFRIKTCCSSQMLINSLREDTEYLLDLGVNGMGESNRTLPVVWLGRVNRYPYPRIKCINYGNLNQVTRSKQKRFSPEKGKEANEAEFELTPPSEGGEDDSFIIPAFEGDGGKSLAKVKGVEFKEEQRKCPDLKPLWDKAQTGIDKEFRVIRGKLVRVAKTKRGEEVRQLCVPIKFRLDINKLSHDEIGGHLGVTKTKDRILRHFFWPNVYRDVEEFVKTCDSCQRVGKPRDKAKAPLKLVPIISEVFSKINIDAVGPLPVSTKQNRYLITSICVASKYPEAIPVESITSPNVIDALLSIFSRIGFPREIQSDLGTSFTSELTTTFFIKFGIKVTRSSVSHPQSNAVERVHRTIKRVIKALCVESGEDWEGSSFGIILSQNGCAREYRFQSHRVGHGKEFENTPNVSLRGMDGGGKHESIGSGIYIAVK
ncbi:retrovirus-related Pol polyprotein from transposon 412 [Trichonephila clavipes]|nr:retrovirus-related Pol polyprotein from transposon 412 [Trichonephila clavipes]